MQVRRQVAIVDRKQRLRLRGIAVRERDLGIEQIQTQWFVTVQATVPDPGECARRAIEIATFAQRFAGAQAIVGGFVAAMGLRQLQKRGGGWVEIALAVELLGMVGVGGGLDDRFGHRRAGVEQEAQQ